ncbi:hypothetical protein Tco_1253548 [Tanacetum coccineum]
MDSIIPLRQKNTLAENEDTLREWVIKTKKYAKLSTAEKIQDDCDMKATNIILQGLPADIYSFVNHHRVAKDLWERVQLLMQGSELSLQERESKLYNEFDKFTSEKGETIHSYYLRFAMLINDMNTIGMTIQKLQVNTKFVNNRVEQHEVHVIEVRMMRQRFSDPLALVANTHTSLPFYNNQPQYHP